MSEVSGGSDAGMDVGGTGEVTSDSTESVSLSGEPDSTEGFGNWLDLVGDDLTDMPNGSETMDSKSIESISPYSNEVIVHTNEITHELNQLLETPDMMEQAQKDVESYHQQSIMQILEMNDKYLSADDRERIANGVENLQAIEHNPLLGRTGGYFFSNDKTSIEVSAINQQQMERSTKHETNHFASKNREIIVPEPDRKGYTVYQTVGIRQSSWFHSAETGQDSNYVSVGRGLNEGLTTMYTNQQLSEISREKGENAERQGIYSHATELCNQLEYIVGKDVLREAYYGGNLQNLETRVDALAGEKGYDSLRECLDRTLSKEYADRVQAMREAQVLLARMYEEGARKG